MSKTPRTDEALKSAEWQNPELVPAYFARTLELELAEANQLAGDMAEEAEAWKLEAKIAQYRLAGKRHPRDNGIVAPDEIVTKLSAELAEARAEIKRLAVAIQAATVLIAAKGRHNTMLAYNGLRAALAAVKAETKKGKPS